MKAHKMKMPIVLDFHDKKMEEKVLYVLKNRMKKVKVVKKEEIKEKYILITDNKGKKNERGFIIRISDKVDLDKLIENVRVLMKMPTDIDKMFVGIDPGKRIGVAILCANILVDAWVSHDPDEVIERIKRVIEIICPEKIVIRIGRGEYSREILSRALKEGFYDVRLVDETLTTRKSEEETLLTQFHEDLEKKAVSEEILSAIMIALRI